MNTGIYEIVCEPSGKRYVGSAVDFRQRWNVHRFHLRRGTHHSSYLQASWRKYGAEAFLFRKLLVCSRENLLLYEQRAIDTIRPHFNACGVAGSAIGLKWTLEQRAKHSERQRANPTFTGRKHTAETLAKMSAAQVGRPSPLKGVARDPAIVEKTASAHRGRKRSPETCAKIAAKAAGRRRSPESVERGAAKLRGRKLSPERVAKLVGNKHALGMRHTPERRALISLQMTGVKRPKSAEHRAKIAATLRGRKATAEHRANQSAAQRGKKRKADGS